MNTFKTIFSTLILALFVVGCSDDDNPVNITTDPPVYDFSQLLNSEYTVNTLQILTLSADSLEVQPQYNWSLNDSVLSTQSQLYFISDSVGSYTVDLDLILPDSTYTLQTTIHVAAPEQAYSPYIFEVIDFLPAPGQKVNVLPKYEDGNQSADLIAKADLAIAGAEASGFLTLGGFGGYVTFRFDHTIINTSGSDLKVLGNASSFSAEPGVIMVGWDKNQNGQPDADEWYEIAGSEYAKESTIKDYSITYYKPNAALDQESGTIENYIKWTDNQGNSGYLEKNQYNTQSYYPLWIDRDSIQFTGTLLADNYVENDGIWSSTAPEFGYADSHANNSEKSNIDIDWAVDSNGQPAKLPGIDFIKVYTAVSQEAGWLGEISTEISGAVDLHLE